MEISKQIQDEINSRQSGMCGVCGRVIDEIDGATREFIVLNSQEIATPNTNNSVQVCNYCMPEVNNMTKEKDYSLKKYSFPRAGFNNYSDEDKLNDFKEEVEKTLSFIETSNDLRTSRNKLNETINTLRTLKFPKEIYEEFNSKLSTKLTDLIDSQKAQYVKMEQSQKENFESIKAKLDEVYKEVIQEHLDAETIKQVREKLITIQNEMNSLNLIKDNKDELLAKFTEAFSILSTKQAEDRERYEMECSENYLTLKPVVEAAIEFAMNHPIFREGKQKLIEAQSKFKGLKLKKDNRDELYNKLQEAFTIVKTRQDEEREVFDKEADINYEKVKPVIEEAINIADNAVNFKEARATLVDAQASIKVLKLRKDAREGFFDAIREAFNRLNERQSAEREVFDKETSENFENISLRLQTIEAELNDDPEFNKIRDLLIAVQADVKLLNLRHEQRNTSFNKIRELFAMLDEKRKIYRQNKAAQRSTRLIGVRSNLLSRINRLEESITFDINSLNFQKEKLQKFAENEDPKVIAETNAKINMFTERVKEKEDNIADLKKRLEDVERDINNIKAPEAEAATAEAPKQEANDTPAEEAAQ